MEEKQTNNRPRDNKPKNFKPRRDKKPAKLYDEIVIDTKPVVKVTKGGRQRRFQAVVIVGDGKGLVGLGTGKAVEVAEAVRKARQAATKNVERYPIIDERTIPFEVRAQAGATRVIIKPASKGTGLVAGGSVRSVLELAGYKDIIAKSLGSRTKINMARATLKALASLRTIEDVARLRGKTKEEILGYEVK